MARKRSPAGFLFWLGLVTAVLVVFVFSRPSIERVLDSTDFFAAVKPRSSAPVVVLRPSGKPPNGYGSQQQTASGHSEVTEPRVNPKPESQPAPPSGVESKPPTPLLAPDHTARVFFAIVDSNGEIQLSGVQRTVSTDIAPLTSILRELLAGPTDAEQRRDLISLLPDEVEIHQVSIQEGTAIIDLGQAFRFSSHGREGLLARLKQLVYSATEFPTIDAVQVLIDGNNVDYLGPEGIYIRKPLTRKSFDP